MKTPERPQDETLRLRSLQNLRVLDTEPEERFDRITRLASRLFGVPIALVSLVDQGRQWFKSKQGLEASETSRELSFCGHTILKERTLVVEDASEDPRFADNPLVVDEPGIRFYAGHPVHGPDGRRIGTLCLIDQRPRALPEADKTALADLASMVDRELALLAQSTTDELTQISNRRGFVQIATYVLALCRRKEWPAAIVSIDLDGFKQINDSLGHETGDTVLREFARLLLKNFRDSDVVARLGGDEFCVLASGATAVGITSSLDRLKLSFAESDLALRHPQLAWSSGVAQIDGGGSLDLDALLGEADRRMYSTKRAHRKSRLSLVDPTF